MYFYKKQGKQYLDLSGNLIFSYNKNLVSTRSKSAAPVKILNPLYVVDMGNLSVFKKIKLSFQSIKFIWMKPKNLLKPTVKKTTSIGISSTVDLNDNN